MVRLGWSKAAANTVKHHLSFEEAITAFDDPCALVAPDPRHSTATEQRRWLIGESDVGAVVIVFTVRQPGEVHRIIRAWRARRKERSRYEEAKRIFL